MYCEGNTDGTVGGSFFSLLYLVSGLDRNKYNPVVVFHTEHSLLPRYHEAGIKTLIIERPKPWVASPPESIIGKLFHPLTRTFQKIFNFIKFFPLTGLSYARLMRKHDIKLLHLNNSIVKNHDWMLGARLVGVKCLTHERGINRRYSKMARYFASRIAGIICISNAVKDTLVSHGISDRNISIIYNGIDPGIVKVSQEPSEILGKHGTEDGQIVIGVIGNIKEWKGQETAIRAMPEILARYPNVVCYLVGDTSRDDQYYKDRLTGIIRELGIEKNIVFTGYTTNVANYLNIMKVVLHTSVAPEPFGRVLIEAMSMKKPLIGTRAGAVPEIIEEGESGFTFEPGNHHELAEKVLAIISNDSLADNMASRGYEIVNSKFNISNNIAATQKLYQQILGK